MAKAAFWRHEGGNFLLSTLPESERRDLARALEAVRVQPGQTIYRQGGAIDYLYFPTTALLSWIGATGQGERGTVGVVGWEGMMGVARLLGHDVSPFEAEVAIAGEVLRVEAGRVTTKFERLPSLQGLLLRYTHTALTQLAQAGVCTLYHGVEQRLCRWLLTAHDRSRGDELPLTQETLAGFIGARRPTVSMVSGTLQKAGLVKVNRGRVVLLDRAGIEGWTCECYWVIRREFGVFLDAPR